jgi:hypothetical protein
MCQKCEAEKIRAKIKQENPIIYKFIDDHNAIWQNALALKIAMINFLEECEEKDLDKHYPNSSEVFTEVLGVLDQIETESFFKCREVLKNVQ